MYFLLKSYFFPFFNGKHEFFLATQCHLTVSKLSKNTSMDFDMVAVSSVVSAIQGH